MSIFLLFIFPFLEKLNEIRVSSSYSWLQISTKCLYLYENKLIMLFAGFQRTFMAVQHCEAQSFMFQYLTDADSHRFLKCGHLKKIFLISGITVDGGCGNSTFKRNVSWYILFCRKKWWGWFCCYHKGNNRYTGAFFFQLSSYVRKYMLWICHYITLLWKSWVLI